MAYGLFRKSFYLFFFFIFHHHHDSHSLVHETYLSIVIVRILILNKAKENIWNKLKIK